MLTLRLWQALKQPPTGHPLYQRTLVESGPVPWYVTWAAILVGPLLLSPTVIVINILYGMMWAMSISSILARAKENGMYALLCAIPSGPLGVSWTMLTAGLYRNHSFQLVSATSTCMIRAIFVAALFLLFNQPIVLIPYTPDEVALVWLIWLVSLIAGVYFDQMQSIILCGLIALFVSASDFNRFEAQMRALGAYLVAQAATYAVGAIVGLVVLPALFRALGINSVLVSLTLPVLMLALFFVLREGLIRVLWSRLGEQLNAAVEEQNALIGLAYS